MTLHSFHLSGHSHRVRLFLSLLNIDHDIVEVDVKQRAQKSPEHLKLNPFGQVPVLIDDDIVISDSTAILVYLARKYATDSWLPMRAEAAAAVQRWLSVASGEIAFGPAAARSIVLFNALRDPKEPIARAHGVLALIDNALAGRTWIATDTPTIADVALYPYIAKAPEGNVDTVAYANVQAWLRRVEGLHGFVPFKATPIGLRAPAAA